MNIDKTCVDPYSQDDLTNYRHNTSQAYLALPEDGGLSAACANQPQYPYHRLISFCGAASRRVARSTYDCWLRHSFPCYPARYSGLQLQLARLTNKQSLLNTS